MSQRQLSDAAGLTKNHVALIESGRRPRIAQQTVSALARALGVSLDWLVDGQGSGPESSARAPNHAA
jgi:transcriptional regulator with XRE-family HTH domain